MTEQNLRHLVVKNPIIGAAMMKYYRKECSYEEALEVMVATLDKENEDLRRMIVENMSKDTRPSLR